jgi:hypothetical protein
VSPDFLQWITVGSAFAIGALFGTWFGWTAKPGNASQIVHASPSFITYRHLCAALRARVAILEASEKTNAISMNSQAAQLRVLNSELRSIRFHVQNLTSEHLE